MYICIVCMYIYVCVCPCVCIHVWYICAVCFTRWVRRICEWHGISKWLICRYLRHLWHCVNRLSIYVRPFLVGVVKWFRVWIFIGTFLLEIRWFRKILFIHRSYWLMGDVGVLVLLRGCSVSNFRSSVLEFIIILWKIRLFRTSIFSPGTCILSIASLLAAHRLKLNN